MNILLINADQLRHDAVGYKGVRPVLTPNLDRLANEGIVYEQAYTPLPVCSPARQSLLCGLRPDYIGATWNYDFWPTPKLDPEICWTKELSRLNWRLGYVGRFHVPCKGVPKDFGFDDFGDIRGYGAWLKEKYGDVQYTGGWLGCENPVALEDSRTHYQAKMACDLLDEYTNGDKPWFMWVDFEEPHLPCRPSKPFSEMYSAQDIEPWDGWGDTFEDKPYIHKQQPVSWNTDKLTWDDFAPMVARYYGCVSQVDDAVGRILDKLKQSGQYDDTLIFFTSDHGDMCASHSMLDKHYVLYDDIIRVPLIMKPLSGAHMITDGFVMNTLDIPATIRAACGLKPLEPAHGRPLPETEKEADACLDNVVVTTNGQQFGLFSARAIRTKTHKYVWNLTDTDELYDLVNDPGEKHNLINEPQNAELVKELRLKLYEQLVAQKDRFAGNEWMKRQLLEGKKL